ncbi:DUF4097 family beta strand repeat-containing protein [Streptomyces tsukubensis]|uniref:DUF4097 domain-containing protein n=1 Tax=Streptomyces tsukubensis TaxID=83656 RepID=A0A1V4ACB7_9ACTN|nr:DUF4097 family beta strand repeat-containing protein [Streptomyces tsukubensis]OON81202.1 hypothetical protein B1H18_07485 [Streptomyces tsukubensis]QFR95686.1 DUF4097 family beta strand repeat protein [Streptomyces tsukubensis]
MPKWSVAEPTKLTFDDPVETLQVRVVGGAVNVVGTDDPHARLHVSEVTGPPLTVTHSGSKLTVVYEDLPWKGFLSWLDRMSRQRTAEVSLTVPAGTRVEVGVVGASATVSGITGHAEVKGVSGDTTLAGLSGPVRAETVSGNVEAQAVTGDLRFNSVSGDLTVVEGAGGSVRAESVSGDMIMDLGTGDRPTNVALTSVSGEIAIRLPHPADALVEANTTSGTVSNAFEDLRVSGQWASKKITGRLGSGSGKLKATTVSGSIALLRRPQATPDPDVEGAADAGTVAGSPGSGSQGPDGGAWGAVTDDVPQDSAGQRRTTEAGQTGATTQDDASGEAPNDKKVL